MDETLGGKVMNTIKVIRRCPGCGVMLQTIDESLPGYVPQKHSEKHEVVLCQRCFKIQHYGEDIGSKESFDFSDFFKILARAKKDDAIIIWVLDILNFETTLSQELLSPLQDLDVYFVATKRDLLPKSLNDDKLKTYIETFLKTQKFPFKNVMIASSKDTTTLATMQNTLTSEGSSRDVYVIGAASSGKSSLVNAYLKTFSNETKRMITTSPFPGTTLRLIEVPLTDKQTLYDTPGYTAEHSLLSKVEKDVIKIIMPKVELKPKHYRLGAKDSLAIGGLARLDVLSGPPLMISFYFANPVEFHRQPLIKADRSFFSLIQGKHIQPISKYFQKPEDFTALEMTLPDKGRIDFAISGYGWISFPAQAQTIRILVPQGTLLKRLASKIA